MRPILSFFILIYFSTLMVAQFTGTYQGSVNGDNVTLYLESTGGNTYKGYMKDSGQNYTLNGQGNGNIFTGTGYEGGLNLNVKFNCELIGNQLNCKFIVTYNGQTSETPFTVYKQDNANKAQSNTATSLPPLPAGATHNADLVGAWKHEEAYNSGYGSDFSGANFSQKMIFLADGRMADGGSQASMSGSFYSAQSSSSNLHILPDAAWYNIGNQLYLSVKANGVVQQVHLGQYYIENGHMLLTGANGKKVLMSRM
jgi:hypothetical protein